MSLETGVKDCPFCGAKAKIVCIEYPFLFAVKCTECMSSVGLASRHKVIEEWNKRFHETQWERLLDRNERKKE